LRVISNLPFPRLLFGRPQAPAPEKDRRIARMNISATQGFT
jgi:hypothetical protein